MDRLSVNEIERKKTLELCEAIVIGFQNDFSTSSNENKVLQKVYDRIHLEVKPIDDKMTRYCNEERGVQALADYLGIEYWRAKFLLDPLLNKEEACTKHIADIKRKACYIGELSQQILISTLEGEQVAVIDVWK